MKLIPLTRGKFAKVDDEDFEWLSQWRWMFNPARPGFPDIGYAYRNGKKGDGSAQPKIFMHRVLMGLGRRAESPDQVDHVNLDRLDNRKQNLRISTQANNVCNVPIRVDNASGFCGVGWHKSTGKWAAHIGTNGHQIHLGVFDKKWKAALAYDYAALEYHGEFARLNLPFLC